MNIAQKVEALERRGRWQMRAIIALLIAFLLNASPAFTSKWFHRLLPPKLTSVNLSSDTSDLLSDASADNPAEEILSRRAQAFRRGQSGRDFLDKALSSYNETPRLSKQAQQAVSNVLYTRELRIVNAAGTVVAAFRADNAGAAVLIVGNATGNTVATIGADNAGDGALAIRRADATAVAVMGVDRVGDGFVLATGASESLGLLSSDGVGVLRDSESSVNAAVLGVDDEGNGVVTTLSTSGSLAVLGTTDSGEAGVVVASGSESSGSASFLGVDDEGNGLVTTLSASGSLATLGVDEGGDAAVLVTNRNGALASVLGVDENGHGVLGVLNASGRSIAAMGADASGNGALGIDGGKFRAFVDASGNGVAETRGRTQNLLWSSESADSGSGGGTPTGLMGDFDNDGDVDFADFLTFAQNFGKTSG